MADQDIALMAHLMRRAGFGANRDELEERVARGYEQTVEDLLDPDTHGVPKMDTDVLLRTYLYLQSGVGPPSGSNRHVYYLINNPRPLEEKMALLWHMVFATGNAKLDNPSGAGPAVGHVPRIRAWQLPRASCTAVYEPCHDLLAGQQLQPQGPTQ